MPKDALQLRKEVKEFLDNLAEQGFRLVTMFDPHGGYMRELETKGEHLDPSRYKYRMQLHFVKPEDYSQSQGVKVKELFLDNMASIEDFSEFEKELAKQITARLDDLSTTTKLQPASSEEIDLFIQSDNNNPSDFTDAQKRALYPQSQTLPRPSFVSYDHPYTFRDLFVPTEGASPRAAVRDDYKEDELAQSVPLKHDLQREREDLLEGGTNNNFSAGWKDWSGGITIRSGFVERDGQVVTYSTARSSDLRFHELRVDTIRELCHDIPAEEKAQRDKFIEGHKQQLFESLEWLYINKDNLNQVQIKQLRDDIVEFSEQMGLKHTEVEPAGEVLRDERDIPVIDDVGDLDAAASTPGEHDSAHLIDGGAQENEHKAAPANDTRSRLLQMRRKLDAALKSDDDPESPHKAPGPSG